MSSSRLPGKVLLDIGGQPMLARVVERAGRARQIDGVVVATTTDPADDAIEALCNTHGYRCFRGHPRDVLDRYYQAARAFEANVVVRLTADCPLIDPGLIDETVSVLWGKRNNSDRLPVSRNQYSEKDNVGGTDGYDFAANRLPPPWKRTYPIGLDVEVCTFSALEQAWREADQPHQREHVMPYLYEQQGRFRVVVLNHEPDYGALRWTVDTRADLELARRIYAHFGGRDDFSWTDVLELFQRHPELARLNAGVRHKTVREVDGRR